MADWSQPTIDSLKVDVLDILKLRDVDSITLAENPTAPPVGAKRWYATTKTFQEWNGTAWVDLIISLAGGGTGNSGSSGAFGTMAYQNSNNVAITGGTIHNLSDLTSSAHIWAKGYFYAGPGIQLTNGSGYINEASISNDTILARVADSEMINGTWTFLGQGGTIWLQGVAPSIQIAQTDVGGDTTYSAIQIDSVYWQIRFYNDARNTYTSPITITRSGVQPTVITLQGPILVLGNLYDGSPTSTSQFGELRLFGSGHGGVIKFGDNTVTEFDQILSSYGTGLCLDGPVVNCRNKSNAQVYFQAGQAGSNGAPYAVVNGSFCSQFRVGDSFTGTAIIQSGEAGISADIVLVSNNYHSPNGGGSGPLNPGRGGSFFRMAPAEISIGMFYTAGAVYFPMSIYPDRIVTSVPYAAPNGSSGAGAYHFNSSPNSGMYYNAAGDGAYPCIEFGTTFNLGGRSVMRTFIGAAYMDFLMGTSYPLLIQAGQVLVGRGGHHTNMGHYGESFSGAHHGYWMGLQANAWYAVASLQYVTTSDIRIKDVHGPVTNVLDAIDSVSPIIASMKESARPDVRPNDTRWTRKFPSFSAQEIAEKLDDVYGTGIVTHDEESDTWGMDYNNLIPLLWQAVKELHARIKVLEP